MTIAIMQPYLLPYIGYWQLINAVDTFVIYDDVNFIKRGFINRNVILENGRPQRFTLELKGASQNKLINEIEVGNNSLKLIKNFELNYKKTPFFDSAFPVLKDILDYPEKNLARFIGYSIKKMTDYLEIDTKLIYSSELDKNNELRAQNKLIDICQRLNSIHYINAINGKKMYQKEKFLEKNIKLNFLETNIVEYKQFGNKNNFISHLSIVDIIMYNEFKDIKKMLESYKLI